MALETIILLALASAFGLYMAWSIGANDVANAMGTSVGSGALTLRKAVLIAAILEFSGAFLVGGHVTETFRKGILDLNAIPEVRLLMLGMLAALLASAIWLQIATYFGWPVSTTHSIVGAIVGFGIIVAGVGAVRWDGVLSIVSSWLLSPVVSGAAALVLFLLVRKLIFEAPNPVNAMRRLAPILIFLVFFVLSLVIALKGLKNLSLDLGFVEAMLIALVISSVAAFIGNEMIGRMRAPDAPNAKEEEQAAHVQQAKNALPAIVRALKHLRSAQDKAPDFLSRDLEESLEVLQSAQYELEGISEHRLPAFHEKSYLFVERVFKHLQILSACAVAFAHGANDVANAIGPLAAVWEIATTGVLSPVVPVSPLLLALGGFGIVVGLATWGWRIIETLGKKITELTPTRGFSAEFGAACTILVASRLGMPISTTHCLVGAVMGVGIARGISSLNLRILLRIFFSWILTIPIAAFLASIIYFALRAILG
ncbi:MAG TPA: inorganic phosphate transporter [Acidobacteriota bacterium]|nr:inorganic phosphate transporter [Acidobacteriota bacterium]